MATKTHSSSSRKLSAVLGSSARMLGSLLLFCSKALTEIALKFNEEEFRQQASINSCRTFRHKKRGGSYQIVAFGRMQCSKPVTDMSTLVIYQGENGLVWGRPYEEFFDGRFEEIK